jgi:hypothetical protein
MIQVVSSIYYESFAKTQSNCRWSSKFLHSNVVIVASGRMC